MELIHLGHSCFKINGKNITVLTDPFNPQEVGLKLAKQEADVVTVSHQHFDHNYLEIVKPGFILFDSPGEYEIKEAEFVGIFADHDDKKGAERGKVTIFTMEIDDIKICHLGDLAVELDSEQLELVDGVDILLIPVGGKYTLDAKSAVKVISQIEPKIVIPMHFSDGKMTELSPLETFLHEIAVEPKRLERLKVSTRDLPEEMELVVLKNQ